MSKLKPLVSVVMPAYNSSRYVIESIQSVIDQTYANWELLVVDDGSTDDTALLVSGVEDSRVKLIRKDNAGVAVARNKGIRQANGEFIAFLDSDDLWCPDKLATQLEFMVDNPKYILVHSGYTSFLTSGVEIPNKQLEPFKIDDVKARLLVFNFIATLTVVVRTSAVREVGGFDQDLFGPEDWDLWIRLSSIGDIGFIPRELAKYREHDAGISKNRYLQLSQEYRVIQKHASTHASKTILRKALWFHSLKLCNYYLAKRYYIKAAANYLRLFLLSPLNSRNFSYPLNRLLGRSIV